MAESFRSAFGIKNQFADTSGDDYAEEFDR